MTIHFSILLPTGGVGREVEEFAAVDASDLDSTGFSDNLN